MDWKSRMALHVVMRNRMAASTPINKSTGREGKIFTFATDEIPKDCGFYGKEEKLSVTFAKPVTGYFEGDDVVFTNVEMSEFLRKEIYRIENISEDRRNVDFLSTGAFINPEKANVLLEKLKN